VEKSSTIFPFHHDAKTKMKAINYDVHSITQNEIEAARE